MEERDAGVRVRDPVQRREMRGRELLAEDRGAEEEVQEAPVRDAEDALALQPRLQALWTLATRPTIALKDSAPGSACSGGWAGIQVTWPVPS